MKEVITHGHVTRPYATRTRLNPPRASHRIEWVDEIVPFPLRNSPRAYPTAEFRDVNGVCEACRLWPCCCARVPPDVCEARGVEYVPLHRALGTG